MQIKLNKTFYFFLAFFIAFLYWVLDAFAISRLHQSSWIEELFFQTPHSVPLLKCLIAVVLFLTTLVPLFIKPKASKTSLLEFGALEKLSTLLFASLATKFNILKTQESFEKLLHLEASIVLLYTQDHISLYNENLFIKTSFHSKDIFPFRANTYEKSDVEAMVVRCFTEKTPLTQEKIFFNDTPMSIFHFLLQEEETKKTIGALMLVSKDASFIQRHTSLIKKYLPMLTFALLLSLKKEQLEKQLTDYAEESKSRDEHLNLLNYESINEHLFYEFKRHKRYKTELTLMLLEINMFENLSKVFPEEAIVTLKKEFVHVIHKSIRDVDILGKWSHNRFAIVLPNNTFKAGVGLANKLQKIIETAKFLPIGKISCSYGITSLSPKDTLGSFKARAENALTKANLHGGNAIEVSLQNNELDNNTL
ncbi:GGDEF domain-containing protein [Sulfurospirillum barnesii]|uniref:Diguanylate cyclase (GGDEF) domain-containing protein n=1 Tax=Sulfurospirillum barnesii (strain ATCC 700032 / DSM 10660 / SES-3) TaxID=760154 RepID=I3XUW3_SULBS|nr:diguanylate cyclase [Sulfurospirillum barnesii]AFL67737.1 diguanylate cyclase (GGDEF) domain-containing protein [Sulfurospirillum barnesii SES-3]